MDSQKYGENKEKHQFGVSSKTVDPWSKIPQTVVQMPPT